MGEEEKDQIRVEDRRFFDREGNPVNPDGTQEQTASSPEASKEERTEQPRSEQPPSTPLKIDFPSLLFIYVQTALMHLGQSENPEETKKTENLMAAQQIIDILELLQEKTRGNLSSQEEQYLEESLFDLRMRYVERARKS
jgi:Domain of unknown function (DUF1844)